MKPKQEKIFGRCHLCLLDKELIHKSHIIPRFFLNRTVNKERKGFGVMSLDASQSKKVHDAAYESGILCEGCDSKILGKYKDYGSKFLYGSLSKKQLLGIATAEFHFEVSNVHYHKLKMFFLALLWKCAISKTFDHVMLDYDVQEYLRKVLFDDELVPESQFPIIIWNYAGSNEIPNEFILSPWIGDKISNEQNFHFLGGGFFYSNSTSI